MTIVKIGNISKRASIKINLNKKFIRYYISSSSI